jgi:hypothetical protein
MGCVAPTASSKSPPSADMPFPMQLPRTRWRRFVACCSVLLLAHATWWSAFALCNAVTGSVASTRIGATSDNGAASGDAAAAPHHPSSPSTSPHTAAPSAHGHHHAGALQGMAPESTRTPSGPVEQHPQCPMAMTCALAALPLPVLTLALPPLVMSGQIDDSASTMPVLSREAPEPPPPRA